ncbi:MAG: 8-amino-7-oxononanoate synthase [Dehalococcoidia bacterium]|nr:8-amino-7-oxononanoate synthase [Dehalococcoidia bacterium]
MAFLETVGLRRSLRVMEASSGPWVSFGGRRVLLLCSNDYLGLASHPKVKEAARAAVENWGCGAGAARLISGTMAPHQALEESLARFLGLEAALLFSSGYLANMGAIASLVGPSDAIFSDQLNHASIVDGCRLSGARVHVYPHRDLDTLEELLGDAGAFRRRLVVTEGLFGMDGDIAPLEDLVRLAGRYGALLMVDDAHGIGMLGEKGRGVLDALGTSAGVHVVVGTLGKSLGSGGAFVAGSRELKDYLVNRARPFIFSTALAPSLAAGALAALDIVESEPGRRRSVIEKAEYLRSGLSGQGFRVLGSGSSIVPVLIGDAEGAMTLSRRLLEQGVYVQGLRPPTVPPGTCRLRCSVTASHTSQDLDLALDAFRKAGRSLGIV